MAGCLECLATLLRTGSLSERASDDGVFDMMGNLHEWTDNSNGVFRGGYYMDTCT